MSWVRQSIVVASLALATLGSCSDDDDEGGADASADAVDCEFARDDAGQIVSCQGASPSEEVPCPDGFECSGLSAFWCYRGTECNLPICLPADALVGTPAGPVQVAELQIGQLIWTVGATGERVASPVVAVGSTLAPLDHQMVRVTLADGRTLRASPGHPGLAGDALAGLIAGDDYDGARVLDVSFEPYGDPRTWDVLPAGETGLYWVDGVLVGSTLRASHGVHAAVE